MGSRVLRRRPSFSMVEEETVGEEMGEELTRGEEEGRRCGEGMVGA